MLNICVKTLWKCQPLKAACRVLAAPNYATFTVRDVLYETSDEAGTLLTRFAKHVALERQKICEQVPSKVKYSDYFPLSDLRYFKNEMEKTPIDQIATVIIFAFTYKSNADPNKFAIILNELDRYAINKVQEMNADTILRTLYAFLFLMPNWMTRLDFYGRSMQRLYEVFNKQETRTKEMFVQFCFYLGLSKRHTNVSSLLKSLLEAHLGKHINEMSTLDIALVSSAAYKTSIIIENESFTQRMIKEVLDISNTSHGNDSILITFIKSMRLQRLHSPKVCEYIENIFQNAEKSQQLQPRGLVHLFAYLSENLWDNQHCIHPLIETIADKLTLSRKRNEPYSQIIRGKDISTFLWSCAQLNCSLSSAQLLTIENSLIEKLNNGEFNYFPDQLVESCLSLWMLGYKTKQLLHAAIKLKSESITKRKQPKVDSRLTVLLSAVQIEEPTWLSTVAKDFEAFNLNAKIPSYILENQDIPYQKIIGELLKEKIIESANLSSPINGINIPGILVKMSSSNVFLELITPKQALHFSKDPVAILRLKVHLLRSLGHKVKVISVIDALNPEILKSLNTDDDMQEETVKEPSESSIKA